MELGGVCIIGFRGIDAPGARILKHGTIYNIA